MDKIGQLVANLEGAAKSLSLEMRRLEEVNFEQRQEIERDYQVAATRHDNDRREIAKLLKVDQARLETINELNQDLQSLRSRNEKLLVAEEDLRQLNAKLEMENENMRSLGSATADKITKYEADNTKLHHDVAELRRSLGHPAGLFNRNAKLEEEVRVLNEKLLVEYAAKKNLEHQLEVATMRYGINIFATDTVPRVNFANLTKFVATLESRVSALESKE